MFHATEFIVSVNLAIIASGLSLTMTAIWNIIVSSSPKEFTGISVGIGALLLFIGMAIGPALAGVYMADHENIGTKVSYPSAQSYDSGIFHCSIAIGGIPWICIYTKKKNDTYCGGLSNNTRIVSPQIFLEKLQD